MSTIYKIRRKSDGLFSMGGTEIRFTKMGKVWKRRADLSHHFSLLNEYKITPPYEDCEVVELELVEVATTPAIEWFQDVKDQRNHQHN